MSQNISSISTNLVAEKILLTTRGEQWISNFLDKDKALARELVSNLVLISTIEFERKLIAKIEYAAAKVTGIVALYGARELERTESFFSENGEPVDATPRGSDIGSEGRVATIIRNLARERPDRFIIHPNFSELKSQKIGEIFFIDDFVGSGKRVTDYIEKFYEHPTIKSWFSYRLLKFSVVCYLGTSTGLAKIRNHRLRPSVFIERSCPTISAIEWKSRPKATELKKLCTRYSRKQNMAYPLGFGKTGALIVFEHSCPNNCPQILWGNGQSWSPLFFGKSISTEVRSLFPAEIVKQEPINVLIEAGESRLARAANNVISRPLPPEWLLVLSLVSKSIRNIEILENATNMSHAAASKVVEACISHGLITSRLRITNIGARELKAARKVAAEGQKNLFGDAEEYYYPKSLRSRN